MAVLAGPGCLAVQGIGSGSPGLNGRGLFGGVVLCTVVLRVIMAGALHSSLLKLNNGAHVHGLHPGEASNYITWMIVTIRV